MGRTLRGRAVVARMIDRARFGEHVALAAAGGDERGGRQGLGLREGATGNAAAVKALLADLVERGLDANRAPLIVIDGANAPHKAVAEAFGRRAPLQRRREHKKRQGAEALPERRRAGGPHRDASGLRCPRRRPFTAPARQSRAPARTSAPRRRRRAARGAGRNAGRDAPWAARKSRTGAVVYQLDRELVQPSA